MDREVPAIARIGFLGIGLMGSPIASRLARAGHDVAVWNRSPAKVAAAVAAGARPAATAAAAVDGADVVFLCLTDRNAVAEVLFGAGDVARVLGAGALVVDLSTIGPQPTCDLAARLAGGSGAQWVDAPLTGGVAGAEAGTLVALVGGEAEHVARLAPLFASFTGRVSHLGPLGTGQAAKLCNQLIVTLNIVAIAEALALAEANGIDPRLLPDALAGGWADSRPLQIIGKRMAARQVEPKIAALGTFAKDIAAALDCAPETGLPLAEAGRALYAAACAAGLADADVSRLAETVMLPG